jgi:hypothetical protein
MDRNRKFPAALGSKQAPKIPPSNRKIVRVWQCVAEWAEIKFGTEKNDKEYHLRFADVEMIHGGDFWPNQSRVYV